MRLSSSAKRVCLSRLDFASPFCEKLKKVFRPRASKNCAGMNLAEQNATHSQIGMRVRLRVIRIPPLAPRSPLGEDGVPSPKRPHAELCENSTIDAKFKLNITSIVQPSPLPLAPNPTLCYDGLAAPLAFASARLENT